MIGEDGPLFLSRYISIALTALFFVLSSYITGIRVSFGAITRKSRDCAACGIGRVVTSRQIRVEGDACTGNVMDKGPRRQWGVVTMSVASSSSTTFFVSSSSR